MRRSHLSLLSSLCAVACTTVPVSAPPSSAPRPLDPRVHFVGRFDATNPAEVRLSWSGTGFVVRFRGTRAQATLRGGRYFTVVVDGEVRPDPLVVSDHDATYVLAGGLEDTEHTIEVYRRTEASFGPTVVRAVEVDGPLLTAPRPARRIELVGDSNCTGYGVEGADAGCRFSAETENHFLSWGAIAARALSAELSTVAWSGKGVVVNYGGDRTEPLPALYDRVIATEPERAGTIPPADLVLVAVAGNDLDGAGHVTDAELVPAYAGLLAQIRRQHPEAPIVCVRPVLSTPERTERARAVVDAAIAQRITSGDAAVRAVDLELETFLDHGCDHHPGVRTHAALAKRAIEYLEAELGW